MEHRKKKACAYCEHTILRKLFSWENIGFTLAVRALAYLRTNCWNVLQAYRTFFEKTDIVTRATKHTSQVPVDTVIALLTSHTIWRQLCCVCQIGTEPGSQIRFVGAGPVSGNVIWKQTK
jgi:hypothetical protein